MNLNQKLAYIKRSLESIVEHTDEDSTVRKVFLGEVIKAAEDGKDNIDAATTARLQELSND